MVSNAQSRYGPNVAKFTGSLRDWTCIPRLHNIAVPTLVYNGEHDSADSSTQMPFFELVPRVRWVTFQDGCHMCHLEDGPIQDKVLRTVGEFLRAAA